MDAEGVGPNTRLDLSSLTGFEQDRGNPRISFVVAVEWRVGTGSGLGPASTLRAAHSDTSMTQSSGTVSVAPLSLPQRVVGMVFSPRATFESVVVHPTWLDILLLSIIVTTVAWAAFLFSPVGSQALLDQMITQAERSVQSGGNAAQATERVQAIFPVIRMAVVGATLVVGPIIVLLISGLLYGVFAAILGGGATFKQVFAVVVHAGIVITIGGLVVLLLNYLRGTMTSATTLGVFVPMLPEDSYLFKLLSTIDLVWIWYLIILAMGLGVLYRRKTSTIAGSFLSLYVVIAAIIAFFKRGA
jgi:hypothetical protein